MSDEVVSDRELIGHAAAVLKPYHTAGGRSSATSAPRWSAPPATSTRGVCIDTSSGSGFRAEHAAIAAMVTAGEYRIAKIVAVWRDEDDRLYLLPPCGRCREFIRQLDPGNLETEVVLGDGDRRQLRELLPQHDWPEPLGPAV